MYEELEKYTDEELYRFMVKRNNKGILGKEVEKKTDVKFVPDFVDIEKINGELFRIILRHDGRELHGQEVRIDPMDGTRCPTVWVKMLLGEIKNETRN